MPKFLLVPDKNTTRSESALAGIPVYTAVYGEDFRSPISTCHEALNAYIMLTGKGMYAFISEFSVNIPYNALRSIAKGTVRQTCDRIAKAIARALDVDYLHPVNIEYKPHIPQTKAATVPPSDDEIDRSVIPPYIKEIRDSFLRDIVLQEFYVNPHLAPAFAACRTYEEIKELRRKLWGHGTGKLKNFKALLHLSDGDK
jgi:hypothetical protein